MARLGKSILLPVILVLVLAAVVVLFFIGSKPYRLSVALPSAPNLIVGGKVLINGFEAGSIDEIQPRNGQAVLDLNINQDFAPLHQGATVTVAWRAVLGERYLTVTDGPPSAPELPDGGQIEGEMAEPVEVDRVLSTFDAQTRAQLGGLVRELGGTLKGDEQNVRKTIETAGPALSALGDVMQGLGSGGKAIDSLVDRTTALTDVLVRRDREVRTVVEQLTASSRATAARSTELDQSMQRLPRTLATANDVLGDVPDTVDEAVPLLNDLQPFTKKLPQFSRKLKPVLQDLRPTVGELKPTLNSLSELLQYTPGLLDSAHVGVPKTTKFIKGATPALGFLRPYIPEATGFLSNWGSAAANYDSNGHYIRVNTQAGPTSFNDNPAGTPPPGTIRDRYPLPGAIEDQPWTDAFGGEQQ